MASAPSAEPSRLSTAELTKSTSSWMAAGFMVGKPENQPSGRQRAQSAAPPYERTSGSYNNVWSKRDGEGWTSGSASEAGPSQAAAAPARPRSQSSAPKPQPPKLSTAPSGPVVLRKLSIVDSADPQVPRLELSATRARAHSAASAVPEWRKEGLGQEMLDALEKIELDRPRSATIAAQRDRPRTASRWRLLPGLLGGGQKSRSGLKDARRAEKRREAEAAAPAQGFEISSPYGVNHSLFLEEHVTPRDQAGAQRKTI